MAYATIADLIAKYRPVETMIGVGSFDVTSEEVNSVFIAQAEGEVDGYLGKKYITPLPDPAPRLITMVTCDLALFNMLAEKQVRLPDWMQERYERTILTLEKLRDGDMVLPTSFSVISTGDQEVWSSTSGFHTMFSPVLDETEQRVDDDRVERDKEERSDDSNTSGCL